jgi:zinc and cadmium transporter
VTTAHASALASVLAVSLVSLVGLLTISMGQARVRKLATLFVSFAVGALLGDAFIHLIPDIFQNETARRGPLFPSLLILGGILVFFVVEKLLRHAHGVLYEQHHGSSTGNRPVLAAINVFGDAIHNFIDGMLIAASYLASPELGVATTVAVLLHEIPQEFADFGILIHSGLSVRKAVLLNLACASVAILGAVIALIAGAVARETVVELLIPITAGGFVYIAAADLIPELQHDHSLRAGMKQTALIGAGIAVMGALTFIE